MIGREVSPACLRQIPSPDATPRAILERAAGLSLIDEVDEGQTLRSAHVLFQNAILDSITQAEATGLHARAAEILLAAEAGAPGEQAQDLAPDLAPDLADHFDRVGDWPRAALYHVRAAQAAWRIYALDVCIDHLTRAETAIAAAGGTTGASATDDARFCDFITLFCRVLDVAGRWRQLAQVASAHLPRLRRIPDIRSRIVMGMLQSKAFNQTGNFQTGNFQDALAGDRRGAGHGRTGRRRRLAGDGAHGADGHSERSPRRA